jgi:hypothetical protein
LRVKKRRLPSKKATFVEIMRREIFPDIWKQKRNTRRSFEKAAAMQAGRHLVRSPATWRLKASSWQGYCHGSPRPAKKPRGHGQRCKHVHVGMALETPTNSGIRAPIVLVASHSGAGQHSRQHDADNSQVHSVPTSLHGVPGVVEEVLAVCGGTQCEHIRNATGATRACKEVHGAHACAGTPCEQAWQRKASRKNCGMPLAWATSGQLTNLSGTSAFNCFSRARETTGIEGGKLFTCHTFRSGNAPSPRTALGW